MSMVQCPICHGCGMQDGLNGPAYCDMCEGACYVPERDERGRFTNKHYQDVPGWLELRLPLLEKAFIHYDGCDGKNMRCCTCDAQSDLSALIRAYRDHVEKPTPPSCPACAGAMPADQMGWPLQEAHKGHVIEQLTAENAGLRLSLISYQARFGVS